MVSFAIPMSSRALSRVPMVSSCSSMPSTFAVAVGETAAMLGPHVGAQVHARRVEPDEERLARRLLPLHVVDGRGRGFVVDRLHALLRQRPGVLDGLLADLA